MAAPRKTVKIEVMSSQLARARGLGASQSGSHHWKIERVTASALVPLSLWFVVSVLTHLGADQPAIAAWIANPFNTVMLIALIAMTFHHMGLGLQMVLEDYLRVVKRREAAIFATKGACMVLGLVAMVSVLRLSLLAH
jgi:succinate dehydrogenase / fumarate reductase membrane anchor subunit